MKFKQVLIFLILIMSAQVKADITLLGKEEVKKFVKYSLWYEGLDSPNENSATYTENNNIDLKEELILPLQNLDL